MTVLRGSFILQLVLFVLPGLAQFNNTIEHPDTTRKFFPVTYGTKKWKPLVGLDANRSYFYGSPVKINGLRLGADYKGVHRFGFGFYGLKKNEVFVDIPDGLYPEIDHYSEVKFKLNYASVFYERVFFKNKKWEIAIPTHLCGGGIEGYVKDSTGNYALFEASSFSSVNTGVVVKYYVFSWLAPRIGGSYRFVFNSDDLVRQAINGPYYSLGLNVMLGDLYKSVFP
jgi:hypothetical protein